MIHEKIVEYFLTKYQDNNLISDIEFYADGEDVWQFYFVYKGQQDYRFSVETSYDENNELKQAVGFYNYDEENGKCSACIGARYPIESDKNNPNQISRNWMSDLEIYIKDLIKEFQLEHVFKKEVKK